jgi:small ligand-binding sensory domain FIST
MKWVSALSTHPSLESALREVVEQAQAELADPADLAIVFISSAFGSEYSRVMPLLDSLLSVNTILGCSGGGVIGNLQGATEEIEGNAGVCLCLASLPDVQVHAFHLTAEQLPDLDGSPDEWIRLIGVAPDQQPHFILLSDPFSSDINNLLQGLDYAYPQSVKVGGLAGASSFSGRGGLFCHHDLFREGTVGVALSGNIMIETIVAQGCRPIGQPYQVTKGERNIVLQVAEEMDSTTNCATPETPLEALQRLLKTLSDEDRSLAQSSLFVGIAQNEFKLKLEPGDFLVRNLLGVDPKAGAIAIGDRVRPGQRIQFHLRDAQTSADELEFLLKQFQQRPSLQNHSAGALMFSCLGRGEGLYGKPNVDSQLFHQYLNLIPLSGFFCNGEIGPVGDTTFLHGYTSVFGICRALH